ncbi:DUF5615 family PIN-like protein [Rhizobium sp. CC-YZS058]|uniref:DUF5615 family PIN-like protein n=1 Tax=Rhizobium sp. CC-YZS058 TaxID=3042153 RepID=UPI002B190C17|nr:DUF5615 family PIN-like protein [Rhizobium sp. CC-YZS058]
MRFLINAQLPPDFCERLRGHGCEAAHVSSLGMASASDAAIWTLAKTESWVVVTKDEDFALRKSLDPTDRQSSGCAGRTRGGPS